MLARVLEGEISPPSTVAADIPKEFDAVTLKGLAKVASGRYLSGRDMALDLERCAGTASAAEVAAWLELTVGDTLSNRATTVAGIEADSGTLTDVADALSELSLRGPTTLDEPIPVDVSSSAPPPQVGAPTMPLEFRVPRTPFEARVTLPEESTSAQNSAVSLARDLPFPRTSRRWRGLALGAAAVLGVTIVAIAVARRAPAAPAVAPQAVVAASEQGVAPPPPTVAAVAAAADSSITTNTVSRPSSPPSASAPPSPRPIVRATAAARPDVRPPAASPHPASKSAFDGLGERQ